MECATVEKQACTTMTEPVSLIMVMVLVLVLVVVVLEMVMVIVVMILLMMIVILTNLVTNYPIRRIACDAIMRLRKLRHSSHNQCIVTRL